MQDLQGRICLVTGAASGIGAAVAAELHGAGARVFCADLDAEGLRAVTAQLPGASGVALDVVEESSWADAISGILSAAGRLEILVHCVGISVASALVETSLADWRRVLAVNLDGAFLATRHALAAMGSAGGVVVHLGSASGTRPAAGAAAYSTSKAGLRMLAATAAKECRQAGWPIRVNVVSPAGVRTPMWRTMPFFRELTERTGSEETAFEELASAGGTPFSEPAEVARVVCFLVSDSARHLTGVDLLVDDGFVL